MKFRKLRIAWSVFCGLACVLLVVLWVRSYLGIVIVGSGGYCATSVNGCFYINEGFRVEGDNDRVAWFQMTADFPT
jgi:hypothetical protein